MRCSRCCVCGPAIWGPTSQPRCSVQGRGGGPWLLSVCVLAEGLAVPSPLALNSRSGVSSLGKTWRCFPGSSGAHLNYLTPRSTARRGGGTGGAHYQAGALCLSAMAQRCRGQAVPAARFPAAGHTRSGKGAVISASETGRLEPHLTRKVLEQGCGACELGGHCGTGRWESSTAEGKSEHFQWARDAWSILACWDLSVGAGVGARSSTQLPTCRGLGALLIRGHFLKPLGD